MIEPYRNGLQNSWKSEVSSTKWFVTYLLQHGFDLFFLKTHVKTIFVGILHPFCSGVGCLYVLASPTHPL